MSFHARIRLTPNEMLVRGDLAAARSEGGLDAAGNTAMSHAAALLQVTASCESSCTKQAVQFAGQALQTVARAYARKPADPTGRAAAISIVRLLMRSSADRTLARVVRRDSALTAGAAVTTDAVRKQEDRILDLASIELWSLISNSIARRQPSLPAAIALTRNALRSSLDILVDTSNNVIYADEAWTVADLATSIKQPDFFITAFHFANAQWWTAHLARQVLRSASLLSGQTKFVDHAAEFVRTQPFDCSLPIRPGRAPLSELRAEAGSAGLDRFAELVARMLEPSVQWEAYRYFVACPQKFDDRHTGLAVELATPVAVNSFSWHCSIQTSTDTLSFHNFLNLGERLIVELDSQADDQAYPAALTQYPGAYRYSPFFLE